ncbi:hypothetical protein BGZ96_009113 [Linnemannia gamsii]|uniref:Uncharacterized protein n=1 Tax=Linnemannia gamsii TaxID=64522 RepID=A0ABQ7JX22_9FUNG|nr:hypothetical protein BGZ96_009113 [Linnemannia gamsii]
MASDRSLPMPSSSPYSQPPKSRTSIPGRLDYRRLLFTLLTLHSLHSFSSSSKSLLVAEAVVSCTYPNYLTEVKAGDTSLLSWQASSGDISTYESLTATLYCMDLNGPQGGMWRNIKTIFSNRGLSIQGQVQFAVPNCGALANNAAIRIVAVGQGSATQNDACYFKMDTKAAVIPPPTIITTTQAPPIQPTPGITKDPPVVTTKDPPGTLLPPATPLPTTNPSTISGQPPTTPTTLPNASQTGLPTTVTTISGTVVTIPYPPTKPYPPLPPLPPLPELPPSPSGGGSNGGSDQTRTLLVSICSAAALVIIVSLLVLRRRRSMRHGRRGINGNHGLKLPHLKLLRGGSKSDQKEGRFHLMDDDDDYDNPEMDGQVTTAAASFKKNQQSRSHDQIPPPVPVLVDLSESTEKSDQQSSVSHRDSSLSYPPTAHLDPTWRRSASFPYDYADDEYTMSSMRSSCETSSVVREYWAASMAARAERRLDGYPPTIDFYDEGSVFGDQQRRTPSFSSMSRKAEILTLDSASTAESNVLPAEDGFLKRRYRNTMNSVQSYLQRSMTMSLSSLHSTFTSSSEEENSSAGGGVGYAPRSRGTGFRPPINSEFLNHLNIKSLRSEERQLEYYTHLYRQNPTMTMSTVNYDDGYGPPAAHSSIMTGDGESWRTSSVPSLTSTNDPFKTFDSNEILLDMSPFADQHAIPRPSVYGGRPVSTGSSSTERNPATVVGSGGGSTDTTPKNSRALMVVNSPNTSLSPVEKQDGQGGGDERSNSTLLGSFPIPPPVTSESELVRSSSGHSSSSSGTARP